MGGKSAAKSQKITLQTPKYRMNILCGIMKTLPNTLFDFFWPKIDCFSDIKGTILKRAKKMYTQKKCTLFLLRFTPDVHISLFFWGGVFGSSICWETPHIANNKTSITEILYKHILVYYENNFKYFIWLYLTQKWLF